MWCAKIIVEMEHSQITRKHRSQIIVIVWSAELRECNELKLRSGCVIAPDEDKNMKHEVKEAHPNKPSAVYNQQTKHGEDTVRQKDPEQIIITSPSFPERLIIPRPIEYPDFDLLGELKNLCIKIPLLQAIQDILIYAKTIKELCVKKFVRKTKITPTVHVIATLFDLLLGKETPVKYEDLGIPLSQSK